MTHLLRASVVSLLGLSLAACDGDGTEGVSDEAAIERLMGEWFAAYEDGDATALTALFVEECADLQPKVVDEMEQLHRRVGQIAFDLTAVDIRNLTVDTASVMPFGSGSFDGEQVQLGSEGGDYTLLVKQSGKWKISSCNSLAGGY